MAQRPPLGRNIPRELVLVHVSKQRQKDRTRVVHCDCGCFGWWIDKHEQTHNAFKFFKFARELGRDPVNLLSKRYLTAIGKLFYFFRACGVNNETYNDVILLPRLPRDAGSEPVSAFACKMLRNGTPYIP